MNVVRDLDTDVWRQFVDEQPAGNIFHTPEMFQVFANTQNHEPELWAITNDAEQILALLLPVKITLMDGLLHHLTSRSVVYGGLLYTSDTRYSQEEILGLLLQSYNDTIQKSLFTELRHQTDSQAIQTILQDLNYQFEEYDNFLINLDLPAEDVFKNISKSARKKIRQAERSKPFVIEELRDRSKLPIWYALIQKTYEKARVPLADISLFEATFDILQPAGMGQFLLGKAEDTYIAASVALLHKGIIYGWYRGFDRDYGHYLPNDRMVWHLLKWGAENGYRTFDFGGAGKPTEKYGPRQFKAKFGGQLVSYGRHSYIHAPVVSKVSQMAYQVYRHLGLKRLTD